jgi:hypothetical protein
MGAMDREYPRLPDILVEEAPSFADSEEARRLERGDWSLPSVVCGAFTRYIERLQLSPTDSGQRRERHLEEAFRAIERLASSPDPEVINTLVVEVFEHLNLPDKVLDEFHSRLGPSARPLYDSWIGRTGGVS